jgi:tetrahydromethanopterin S-methyltransferase subunit G
VKDAETLQEVQGKLDEIEQRAALVDAEHCRVITRRLDEIRDLIEEVSDR